MPGDGYGIDGKGQDTVMPEEVGALITAQCEGRREVRRAEKIRLVMNLSHLHLFDAQSKESLYT